MSKIFSLDSSGAITYYLMVSSAVTQMIVQLFMALVWDLKEVVGI